jgi:hypothetical protein
VPTPLNALPRTFMADAVVNVAAMTDNARRQMIIVPVSFEAGEQMSHRIFPPYNWTVQGFRVQVTKALAATDAATIELRDTFSIPMGGAPTVSLPASTVIGTTVNNSQAITAGNSGAATVDFVIFTSKTTPGGKANVMVEVTKW